VQRAAGSLDRQRKRHSSARRLPGRREAKQAENLPTSLDEFTIAAMARIRPVDPYVGHDSCVLIRRRHRGEAHHFKSAFL
jgi:hypothetical protein